MEKSLRSRSLLGQSYESDPSSEPATFELQYIDTNIETVPNSVGAIPESLPDIFSCEVEDEESEITMPVDIDGFNDGTLAFMGKDAENLKKSSPLSRIQTMLGFGAKRDIPITIRDISDEVLLSFPVADRSLAKREASLRFEAAKTSIMVFGATGEGKTKSVAIPFLHRMHELGCPGLVLDVVKSDFADLCRRFDNALIIGPVEDSTPINLIAGWNKAKFVDFLKASVSQDAQSGGFWGSEGITDAGLIFSFVKDSLKRTVTLVDVYDYFMNPSKLISDIERFIEKNGADIATNDVKERIDGAYVFSVFHIGLRRQGKSNLFNLITRKSDNNTDADSQFAWQTSRVLTLLRPFASNPMVRAKLCHASSGGMEMADLIYRKNKIIVLDMPSVQFGECATTVGQILRMQYRDAIIEARAIRAELGYGTRRFSFTLLDEYQRYATGIGSAHGSADEANWSDISREFGNINIYLSQSISSLVAASGSDSAVATVVQNCRNIIFLPTFDRPTLELIKTLSLSDRKANEKMIRLSSDREAFIYFARGGARGSSASGICNTNGSRHAHMNQHLVYDLMSRNISLKTDAFDSIRANQNDMSFTESTGYRLVVITTNVSHDGYIDFATEISEQGRMISRVFGMPPTGSPEARLRLAIERYVKDAKDGDILAIVRGGGDRSSMTMFDSVRACALLDTLTALGVFVVSGVGHTKDCFAIDSHASKIAKVPLQAAQIICELITYRESFAKTRKAFLDLLEQSELHGNLHEDLLCSTNLLVKAAEHSEKTKDLALEVIDSIVATEKIKKEFDGSAPEFFDTLRAEITQSILSFKEREASAPFSCDSDIRDRLSALLAKTSIDNIHEEPAPFLSENIKNTKGATKKIKDSALSSPSVFNDLLKLEEKAFEQRIEDIINGKKPTAETVKIDGHLTFLDSVLTSFLEKDSEDILDIPSSLIDESIGTDTNNGFEVDFMQESALQPFIEQFDLSDKILKIAKDFVFFNEKYESIFDLEGFFSAITKESITMKIEFHDKFLASWFVEKYAVDFVFSFEGKEDARKDINVLTGYRNALLGTTSKEKLISHLSPSHSKIRKDMIAITEKCSTSFSDAADLDKFVEYLQMNDAMLVLGDQYHDFSREPKPALRFNGKYLTDLFLPFELPPSILNELFWDASEKTRTIIYEWMDISPQSSAGYNFRYVKNLKDVRSFANFVSALAARDIKLQPTFLKSSGEVRYVRYIHRGMVMTASTLGNPDASWSSVSHHFKYRHSRDISLFAFAEETEDSD